MPPSRRRPTPAVSGQARRPKVAGLRKRPDADSAGAAPTEVTPTDAAPAEVTPTEEAAATSDQGAAAEPATEPPSAEARTAGNEATGTEPESGDVPLPAPRDRRPRPVPTLPPPRRSARGQQAPGPHPASSATGAPADELTDPPEADLDAASEPAAAEPTGTENTGTENTDPENTDPADAGPRSKASIELHPPAEAEQAGQASEPSPEPASEPVRSQRPAGKRRAAGTARPEDLSEAEAKTGATRLPDRPVGPRRRANRLAVAGVLALVAVVLVGLAIWFRGEADALASGDANSALSDPATTSEVIGQLTSAVEDTFSYNYTDLASTEKAVDSVLTGKARCEYDQLFGQVQELAPKQKIIMATAVRDIALVRLDGDRAEALVFIDQSSTRVDTNKSVAGEAQFGVLAHRDGDRWKITEFNMFDQQLVTGQPAPKC